MEEFKNFNEITELDEKHRLLGSVTGLVPSLEGYHKLLREEVLNKNVPEAIQGQFNVAKNMALYSYFFYALAPEVHLKTYTVIEHALRIKANSEKPMMFKKLMKLAVKEGWISDSGFRHIKDPSPDNSWCKNMIDVMPSLRNSKAHGSTMLVGDCLHHITSCLDFINQLFPSDEKLNKSKHSEL